MFCTKCGQKNDDGMEFCVNCGAPLKKKEEASYQENVKNTVSDAMDKVSGAVSGVDKKVFKYAGIAVAALVVVIIAISIVSSRVGINRPLNALESGLKRCNVEKMVGSMIPKDKIDEIMGEAFDDEDIKDIEEEMKETMDDMDIKGISIKKLKEKNIKKDEKDEVKETLDEADISCSKVAKYRVEISYKADGDKNSEKMDVIFYKTGMNWYIYPLSGGLSSFSGFSLNSML